MKEVYPGIFSVSQFGSLGALTPPVNIYVIAGKNGIIFDAGYGNKKYVNKLANSVKVIEKKSSTAEPVRIERILTSHSHGDHFSGLANIKKKLGIKVLLTEKQTEVIRSKKKYRESYHYFDKNIHSGKRSVSYLFIDMLQTIADTFFEALLQIKYIERPDIIIKEDETLHVGHSKWEILHLPGHCDDHISLYNEKEGVLLSGDNIMRSVTVWLGPPRSDLSDYQASLEKILALPNLKLILSAHGSPVTNPKERIQEILAHRTERTNDVLEIIRLSGESGVTLKGINKKLYGRNLFLRMAAEGWISLTLDYLRRKNLITRFKKGGYIRFKMN